MTNTSIKNFNVSFSFPADGIKTSNKADEIITIAIFAKLFVIKIVARRCLGVSINFFAINADLLSSFFRVSFSNGFNEKKC